MTYFPRAALTLTAAALVFACSPSTAEPPQPIQVDDIESMDEEHFEKVIGSINPLENDLRGLEIATRVREGFRIKQDGATFNLGVTDGAGEIRLDEQFTLVATTGIQTETLTNAVTDGFYLRTYKLSEADHPRIHAADTLLQQLKRDHPGENKLTFNAKISTCAEPGISTPDTYTFAIFVRTSPDVDFVALSGDVNIAKDSAGPFQAAWDACGS